MMTITLNNINYVTTDRSTAQLIKFAKGIEGQTALPESQASIDTRNYQLSTRNGANAYQIDTSKEQVFLNFIAQKVVIFDSQIIMHNRPEFEFFVDTEPPIPEPFALFDGQFFRCVSELSTPSNKESYTYYVMQDGEAKRIPNYKTLEVMLAERNLNLLSVRVLEDGICSQVPQSNSLIPNKSAQWKPEFADITNLEALQALGNNAKEAAELVEEAKGEVQGQIDAVKAQAAADKAAAEAAKAEAEAATAASAAAQAEAAAKAAELQAKIAEIEAGVV